MDTWGDLSQHEAERIIESLRSGVPFPSLAERLPIGRSRLLSLVRERLGDERPAPLIVRAHYGDGKTHFLQAIAGQAQDSQWVVSRVSISREAPLSNLDKLYSVVAQGTRVPGSRQVGIQPILEHLRGRTAEVLAQLQQAHIPERLQLSVEAYLQDELQYRDELLADLSGDMMAVSRLRQILKELFGQSRRFDRYTLSRDPIWTFRLLAQLIQLAGYQGWVLLIDELELIGKVGLGARAHAYANLIALTPGGGGPERTLVVGALASNYYTDVIEEKQDTFRIIEWLTKRGRTEEAQSARAGLALLEAAEALPPLSSREMRVLFESIREAHGVAYQWAPPDLDRLEAYVRTHVPGNDSKVRTCVRTAVQWLDLWFQYGRDPEVVVWQIGETDLTEGTESPADVDDKPVLVTRNRLF